MKLDKLLEREYTLKQELHSDLWDGDILKSEVREKLFQIAYAFIEYVGVEGLIIEDIIFTGSLANYNYNDDSDIDLHIITDFDNLPVDCPLLADDYFQAKKSLFNQNHNISIYGHPVELYIEDIKTPSKATGKYSIISDNWVVKPIVGNQISLGDPETSIKFLDIVRKIRDVVSSEYNVEEAEKLMNEIYELRQNGLSSGGELSFENICFKQLRSDGYIKLLRDYITRNYDKSLSL